MELNLFHHLTTLFNSLSNKIDTLIKDRPSPYPRWKSDQIDQLGIFLAKAQAEMPSADLNKSNPYFKSSYADLKSIVNASRPYLTKYGLSVIQNIYDDSDGSSWLVSILLHGESGQWVSSRKRIVSPNGEEDQWISHAKKKTQFDKESHEKIITPKNNIQSYSSHLSYLKRLCYASLIGVVTGDEDDDGEAAVSYTRDSSIKSSSTSKTYSSYK